MHCGSCALLIESELEDRGVKAKCNFAKSTLEVEFDENNFSETEIKNAVSQVGYSLDPL